MSKKKIYEVVVRDCVNNRIFMSLGFYSTMEKAKRHVDWALRVPLPGTRRREVAEGITEQLSMPEYPYNGNALLYGGTEWENKGGNALDWLIVEHYLDPLV